MWQWFPQQRAGLGPKNLSSSFYTKKIDFLAKIAGPDFSARR
jgi:hypothetical protein